MAELFYQDTYQTRLETEVVSQDAQGGLILADTIFYPQGGGQPADTGTLCSGGVCYPIVNTLRDPDSGQIVHYLGAAPTLPPGTRVSLELDWSRRYRHMRMHTCQHLLTVVLPYEVTGGNLNEEGGRMDFNLPEGVVLDKETIQRELDRLVGADYPVHMKLTSSEVLRAQPDLVKTMSAPPPMDAAEVHLVEIEGIDLQSCAGTHVRRTGEIGQVQVKKIENKGARNKRVHLALL
ncbi:MULTISPECIES: alanyl-tRNA editing protein [unclassified Paludibacterium]|uniref:alanyl-tRNA editing protein n=1 Tax=unclassified Paludibacterium TaxID=2618429 RepID=UPI001C040732|nr:alanyl-tRNA editing protein [Paludibacterium sp. B53371]BEV73441.1 alanyl-tRNA editing protein [Paludibacterium sp. THUN1379]